MATQCKYSIPTASRVNDCPHSKEQWNQRAQKKMCWHTQHKCDKKPLEYHCLLNAYQNESIEVCAPKTRLIGGFCPSFNFGGARVTDQFNCSNNLSNGCPMKQYFSNIIYEYPYCLQKTIKTDGLHLTTRATTFTPSSSGAQVEDLPSGLIPLASLLVPFLVCLIILVAVSIYHVYLLAVLLGSDVDFKGKQCFKRIFHRCVEIRQDREMERTRKRYIKKNEERELLIPEEIRILILGETGSGKSSTGNTILGHEKFDTDFSAEPVTLVCQKEKVEKDNECISVVDTPGIYETSDSSKGYFGHVKDMEKLTEPGPHAILIVLNPMTIKLGINAIQFIEKTFGTDVFEYCILLLTREDDLKREGKNLDLFLSGASELTDKRIICKQREIAFDNVTKDHSYREDKVSKLMQMIQRLRKENNSEKRLDHFSMKRKNENISIEVQ